MKNITVLTFLCLLVLFTSLPSIGQHQPVISQFMLNKFLFNPALTGLKDQTTITAGYRNQWTAIDGAPVSYYLTGHTPIGGEGSQSHIGVGGTLFTDKIGPLRTSTVSMSGAYHTPISEEWHLSAGIGLGLSQRNLNTMEFHPGMNHDPAIAAGIANQLQPYVSLGLWAFSSHAFFGLSTIQAPAHDLHSGLSSNFVNSRHYFFNTGVMLRLNKTGFASAADKELLMIPSAIVRYLPNAPAVYDFNVRLVYANIFMLGASYRNSRDVMLQVGAQIVPKGKGYGKTTAPGYFFAYSYDLGYSELGQVSAGAHEITVGIHIFKDKVKCPLVKQIPAYFF